MRPLTERKVQSSTLVPKMNLINIDQPLAMYEVDVAPRQTRSSTQSSAQDPNRRGNQFGPGPLRTTRFSNVPNFMIPAESKPRAKFSRAYLTAEELEEEEMDPEANMDEDEDGDGSEEEVRQDDTTQHGGFADMSFPIWVLGPPSQPSHHL
jgi:hypothetical protein